MPGPMFGVLAARALLRARPAQPVVPRTRRRAARSAVGPLAVALLLLLAIGLATASGAIAQ